MKLRANEIYEDYDLASQLLAQKELLEFTKYTFDGYIPNWHHEVMCKDLDDFIQGRCKRLIIEVPPQHGKSELASKRMVAMLLGINPNLSIVNAGYSHTHTQRFNIETQRIIESKEYRDIFPETTIKGKYQKCAGTWERNVDKFDVCGYNGCYKTVGIGGALTGFRMDVGIIDDPFKDYEESRSENRREAVWNWYTSVFRTRMHKDTRICVIMTRWHEDDLIGRIRTKGDMDDGEDWRVITLRGIKETGDDFKYDIRDVGEALWPDRFPINFLMAQKFLDDKNFNSLYQQRPSSQEGGIFKRKDMQESYTRLPDHSEFDSACLSWDMTFKDHSTSDYVVGQVWAKKGANIFLLDEVREIMDFNGTLEAFIAQCDKFPWIMAKLVEDKANGPAIISSLKDRIMGIIPINPDGSKIARASAISPLFKAGNVKLPAKERCPWIDGYKEELISFPDGKYDDRVDATSQALRYLTEGESQNVIVW